MKASCWRTGLALALLLVGFTAGNVIAGQAMLHFEKASLYAAMEKIHAQTDADIAFIQDKDTPLTFEVPVEARERMIRSAAAQYGKSLVKVQDTYVLKTALSKDPGDIKSRDDLRDAMQAWLQGEVGGTQELYGDLHAMNGLARDSVQGISPGARRFGDLSPDEQRRVLEAARLTGYSFALMKLISLAQ